MPGVKTVLIADSSELTRNQIASILRGLGHDVLQAIDGGSAIKVVQEHPVDLILFDHIMSPVSGFDFARYVLGEGKKIPMIVLMTERTSDLLNFAGKLGITHFLTKPVDPVRLSIMVQRLFNIPVKAAVESETGTPLHFIAEAPTYTPDELMRRAIELAAHNVRERRGGPFGAVVADAAGHIIGEGTNLYTSRCDPIAHAEVMAIRQATEKLQQDHLEGCSVFCSSQPTMIGQALIESVGIKTLYYGLSHDEIKKLRRHDKAGATSPKKKSLRSLRLGEDAARALYQDWLKTQE